MIQINDKNGINYYILKRENYINKIIKNIKCILKLIKNLLIIFMLSICNMQKLLASNDTSNNSNKECRDFYYQNHIINKQLVQTVTVNPKKYKIINTTAISVNKNVAHVSQMAKKYHALMAINGGFFREIDKNLYVPAGALKINNTWQGITYQPRASIGWQPNTGLVLIDRIKTQTSITIQNHKFPVNYFNPHYNMIKNCNNCLNKISIYSSIYPYFNNLHSLNHQNIPIKEQGNINYIYNINKIMNNKFNLIELENSKINIEVSPQLEPENINLWNKVNFITSGTPILIKNNKLLTDHHKEKITYNFINNKYPRTAICILNNGFWKFVTVANMNIPELAKVMIYLECKDAINLDGGGSSEMYLSTKIFNSVVSNTIVNPITDIIMVLPD